MAHVHATPVHVIGGSGEPKLLQSIVGESHIAAFDGEPFTTVGIDRLVLYWTQQMVPYGTQPGIMSCNGSIRWFFLPGDDIDAMHC